MTDGGLKPRDPTEWLGQRVFYWITGPATACWSARLFADRLGLWPIPETQESVAFVLRQITSLLLEMIGLPVAVVVIAAAILARRHWRRFLPLWFLAAGAGVGSFADWHAEGTALRDVACLSLLLYGLSATWIAGIYGIPRLASLLSRRSS